MLGWASLTAVFAVLTGLYHLENPTLANISFAALLAPLGANLRYLLGRVVPRLSSASNWPVLSLIPTGTLLANFLASFFMALTEVVKRTNLMQQKGCDDAGWLLFYALQSGFLASLSTVSTFMSEVHSLRASKHHKAAYSYLIITLLLCVSTACLINGVGFTLADNPVPC